MAEKPDKIPQPVLDSIAKFVKHHKMTHADHMQLLSPKVLQWDSLNGCYGFKHGGIYFGIELDGYLHS